jgi:hypothetical protein
MWMRKKKKGEKIEENEGREMKSTLKEDEKEEEVKESSSMEKSPSSQSLISPHSSIQYESDEVRKSEERKTTIKEEERRKEEEKRENKKKKKEKKIEVPSSTSLSLNYLLEGFSTLPPFMKSIVDVRDSLSYQMKRSIRLMYSRDLEQLSTTVGFWVGTGISHLLSTHSGIDAVNHLSPCNICFCPDGTIVITSFDLSGMEEGKGNNFSSEWRRYSSPEMLKGEIRESNLKSVVFVLGMIINSMLNKEIAFKDVDCVSAGELIIKGERPSVSLISKEHKSWMSCICNWLKENIKERISMNEFLLDMDKLRPKGNNLNSKKIERNKEKKEIEEKKPTLTKSQ